MQTPLRVHYLSPFVCLAAAFAGEVLSSPSSAQVNTPPVIEISYIPSPGVSGFKTYFFDVVPPQAAAVVTVAARFAASSAGAMRQVNPFGLSTVFIDNNGTIVDAGESPLADSQFEFRSSDAVIVIDTFESNMELRAALGGLDSLKQSFTIAHVVLADGISGEWQISVVQKEGDGVNRQYHEAGVFGPEGGQVPGDYNGNGAVDAADYALWRDTLGHSGGGLAADGNGNQQVEAGDYDLWRSRFGQAAGGGAVGVAVPEPATYGLLLIAAAANRWRRRGHVGQASA